MAVKSVLGVAAFFVTLNSAWASLPDGVSIQHCESQAKRLLVNWKSKDQWRKLAPVDPRVLVYRTPTQDVSYWIEAAFKTEGPSSLSLVTSGEAVTVSWTPKECAPTMSIAQHGVHELSEKHIKQGHKVFGDQDLKALLAEKQPGVLYVWSPGMIYSLDVYPAFKEAAQKLGLKVTTLLDPLAAPGSIKNMQKRVSFKLDQTRVTSIEFFMRSMGLHYPAFLVYSHGKLSATESRGADDVAGFTRKLKHDLSKVDL